MTLEDHVRNNLERKQEDLYKELFQHGIADYRSELVERVLVAADKEQQKEIHEKLRMAGLYGPFSAILGQRIKDRQLELEIREAATRTPNGSRRSHFSASMAEG